MPRHATPVSRALHRRRPRRRVRDGQSTRAGASLRRRRRSRTGAQRRRLPSDEWERINDPATAGYCADKLQLVTARAKELSTTAMMAVVGGRVLYEYGDVTTVSYLASVRKSVLAMLYGNYVDERHDPAREDSRRTRDRRRSADCCRRRRTQPSRDLLGARSGVYHEASNAGDDLAYARRRADRRSTAPTTSIATGTSTRSERSSSRRRAGTSTTRSRRTSRSPIGMQDFDRAIAPPQRGHDEVDAPRLSHELLDARHGAHRLVMLRDGNWDGEQIVPRDWVQEITSRRDAGRAR